MKFLLFNMIRKLPWIFIGFLPIYLITYVTKEPFPFLVQRLLFFRQGGTFLLSFLPLYHLFFLYMGVGETTEVRKQLMTEWIIRSGDKRAFIKQDLAVLCLICVLFSTLFFSIGLVSGGLIISVAASSIYLMAVFYFLYLTAIYFYSLLFYYLSMVTTTERALVMIAIGTLALIVFNPTERLIDIAKIHISWWKIALIIYLLGIFVLMGKSIKKGLQMEVTNEN